MLTRLLVGVIVGLVVWVAVKLLFALAGIAATGLLTLIGLLVILGVVIYVLRGDVGI